MREPMHDSQTLSLRHDPKLGMHLVYLQPNSSRLKPLAPVDPEGPAMLIQVTTFACGGIAIGIRLAHPLSDAHTLALFARDWACIEHAVPNPIFNPQLLDAYATASEVDEALVREARKLPCNRYDWWISGSDCPFPSQATVVPPGFDPPADVGGDANALERMGHLGSRLPLRSSLHPGRGEANGRWDTDGGHLGACVGVHQPCSRPCGRRRSPHGSHIWVTPTV